MGARDACPSISMAVILAPSKSYLHIFTIFPNAFLQAIRNLEKKRFIKSKNKKSYYSLPNKKDYGNFLKKNGNIILMSDFFKINKLI